MYIISFIYTKSFFFHSLVLYEDSFRKFWQFINKLFVYLYFDFWLHIQITMPSIKEHPKSRNENKHWYIKWFTIHFTFNQALYTLFV